MSPLMLKIIIAVHPEVLAQCYALRYEVLRKPWNQPKGSEQDNQEETSIMAAALDMDGRVIGTARIQFNSEEVAQIRYMAVASASQGLGVGKAVLTFLEAVAQEQHRKTVMLNARENAIPFYLSQGYHITGEAPTLWGVIKHVCMQKNLNNSFVRITPTCW
jgi:predicted GNAT family N-acyltransferase